MAGGMRRAGIQTGFGEAEASCRFAPFANRAFTQRLGHIKPRAAIITTSTGKYRAIYLPHQLSQ